MAEYVNGLVQERRNSIASALELRLSCTNPSVDGLVQKGRNSIANALELRLSCTNPSMCINAILRMAPDYHVPSRRDDACTRL